MSFVMAGSAISLGLVALMAQSILAKQMDEWRLLPRLERVTELYFTDYRQLPASVSPGAQQTVAFTVHNLEHRKTDYRYKLTAMPEDEQTERQLGAGKFTLNHNDSAKIRKTVTLPLLDKRVAVKVTLEYMGIASGESTPSAQKQAIHYWVTTDLPDQKEDTNEDT